MRKILIALAATGTALAAASPAAAQFVPSPPPYGYGQNYGSGQNYGYHHSYGRARALQARLDRVQGQIRYLRDRRMISHGEAESLRERSREVERRLRRAAQYGLSPYEAQDAERRIARLERRLYREVKDGRHGGWGNGGRYDDGYGRYDRNEDGRDYGYDDDRRRDRYDD